jgi:hypothetical protein
MAERCAPAVRILGVPGDAEAARLRRLLDGTRARVVVWCGPVVAGRGAVLYARMSGFAVVHAPGRGAPADPGPWWSSLVARTVLADPAVVPDWRAAGLPLGRLAVVRPSADDAERSGWQAILAEVGSMAHRGGVGAATVAAARRIGGAFARVTRRGT